MTSERTRRPGRAPSRRPIRRRTHGLPAHHQPAPKRADEPPEETSDELVTKTGGGGVSGHGPIDDDGDRWRREPEGDDDRGALLIVLGILSLGAAVLTARVLSQRGSVSRWRPR
jgi:hypothetical protein